MFPEHHCLQGAFVIIDLTNRRLTIFICLSIGHTVCCVPRTKLGVGQTKERHHGAGPAPSFWSGGREEASEMRLALKNPQLPWGIVVIAE